jgi:transposase-like protein
VKLEYVKIRIKIKTSLNGGFMDSTREWIEQEFNLISFKDKRLDKRLIKIASTLADTPQTSINQAFKDWKSVKAAYNFFKNPKVKTPKIWEAHDQCTYNRIKPYPVILVVQDTVLLS